MTTGSQRPNIGRPNTVRVRSGTVGQPIPPPLHHHDFAPLPLADSDFPAGSTRTAVTDRITVSPCSSTFEVKGGRTTLEYTTSGAAPTSPGPPEGAPYATSGALASSRDALRVDSDLRAYGPFYWKDGTVSHAGRQLASWQGSTTALSIGVRRCRRPCRTRRRKRNTTRHQRWQSRSYLRNLLENMGFGHARIRGQHSVHRVGAH